MYYELQNEGFPNYLLQIDEKFDFAKLQNYFTPHCNLELKIAKLSSAIIATTMLCPRNIQ